MLYVFHVDTGTMNTFDMSLTTESVQHLKEKVASAFRIPPDKQVLLISGGICLDAAKTVCSYSSGTDTNPIYLFSRSVSEPSVPSPLSIGFKEENELAEQIRECTADLAATYETVDKRARLSQRIAETGEVILRDCKNLVQDQHRQHQGWSAVSANLEDGLGDFRAQAKQLECDFTQYLIERDYYLNFMKTFKNDLQVLRRIPLLSKLVEKQTLEKPKENGQGENAFLTDIMLLEYLGCDDNADNVEMIYEKCQFGLLQYDENVFKSISEAVQQTLVQSDINNMREVKGLGDRLCGLEQLMATTQKLVQEQGELAFSVAQNQSRLMNEKDASLLPDLCNSHRKQLMVMANNHLQICDIRRRCIKAKEELCSTLSHRLRWVVHIQNTMLTTSDEMDLYSENLGRLRYQLNILEQAHMAPAAYLSGIAEVVRRRDFSQAFLMWASEAACRLLTIYNEEVAKRKEFMSTFQGHFIHALFPGMEDEPPAFATEAPSLFDMGLPKLTIEDVEILKQELPDMIAYFNAIGSFEMPNFLLEKSIVKTDSEKMYDQRPEQKPKMVDSTVQKDLNDECVMPVIPPHGIPQLKDLDKGCESETDTEEFEKVGQSPLELNFDKDIPSPKPGTQDASTLTEGNLEVSKTEYGRLKSLLSQIKVIANQTILQLKLEVADLKVQFFAEKSSLQGQLKQLTHYWQKVQKDVANRETNLMRKISTDHMLEINDFRKLADIKNEEIQKLRKKNALLLKKIEDLTQKNKELTLNIDKVCNEASEKQTEFENRLSTLEHEKEKVAKEVSDRLSRKHQDQLNIIRARFKLITMERSPSEGSLEKIDRGEFSSLTNHESIINQLTENFEIEREELIKTTTTKEAEKWERTIEKLRAEFEAEKHDLQMQLAYQFNKEKEEQIKVLNEHEKILTDEINKHKNTIHRLTNSDMDAINQDLTIQLQNMKQKNIYLRTQLHQLKSEKVDLSASVVLADEKADAATSYTKHSKSLSKSAVGVSKIKKVSIAGSLHKGDEIVIAWDKRYENFCVVHESDLPYFLHLDCLKSLGLHVIEEPTRKLPNKSYCFGLFIKKEYCVAKKTDNRYRVPKDTVFYRITVAALKKPEEKSSCEQSETAPVLAAKTRRVSEPAGDIEYHSLPNSPKIASPEASSSSVFCTQSASSRLFDDSERSTSIKDDKISDRIEEEEDDESLPFSSAVSVHSKAANES